MRTRQVRRKALAAVSNYKLPEKPAARNRRRWPAACPSNYRGHAH